MKTLEIKKPTQYKHCIITPVAKRGGFDVFEDSGRWFHVKTQKQAKWWASVHTRLQEEFGSHAPKAVPTPDENHTPVTKQPTK
jgi:hypothetical protein